LHEPAAHTREPDADAIAQMALENYVEMRDSVRDPRFILQKLARRASNVEQVDWSLAARLVQTRLSLL
jgi:hypothetical protein